MRPRIVALGERCRAHPIAESIWPYGQQLLNGSGLQAETGGC
jgi:hypothetical protein